MAIFTAAINSGSNGNCYYIGTGTEAVLVDAGISCRETERRMKKLGLDMQTVKAVFISHEHSDHITGLPGIAKKYQLPVYITPATLAAANLPLEPHLVHSFTAGAPVQAGSLSVLPFRKFHDAADPHSFMVSGEGINIGVITDIGHACPEVTACFSRCHAVFLEANYCEDMLRSSHYPWHLKQRISSNHGHLSNTQALALLEQHRSPQLQHLVLAHLSKNNNSPQLVHKLFAAAAGSTEVTVASRYAESALLHITASGISVPEKQPAKQLKSPAQLSLF